MRGDGLRTRSDLRRGTPEFGSGEGSLALEVSILHPQKHHSAQPPTNHRATDPPGTSSWQPNNRLRVSRDVNRALSSYLMRKRTILGERDNIIDLQSHDASRVDGACGGRDVASPLRRRYDRRDQSRGVGAGCPKKGRAGVAHQILANIHIVEWSEPNTQGTHRTPYAHTPCIRTPQARTHTPNTHQRHENVYIVELSEPNTQHTETKKQLYTHITRY